MYIVIVLLLMLSIHLIEKHRFVNYFSAECKHYIQYLHNIIFKIENVQGDLLSHQIKFKKVTKEIELKKSKSSWFS
jgi:hypothetical protein